MFSTQPHNQVLYHLAQLTSVISPRSRPLSVNIKKQNDAVNDVDSICYESLNEAAKHCTELSLYNIDVDKLVNKIQCKGNNKWIELDNLFINSSKEILKTYNLFINSSKEISKTYSKWKISYISESSFSKNKRGFPCSELTEPIILPAMHLPPKTQYRLFQNVRGRTPFQLSVQLRHFKTEHGANNELKRNPSLGNRIKKWLGKPATSDAGVKESLQSLLQNNNAEKLKVLFNNSNLSSEEQKTIKLAFVEGYEAGLQKHQRKTRTPLKFIACVMMVVVAYTYYRWYNSMSGSKRSVFSLQYGQRHEIDAENINVTFEDVKGANDAKKELQEIVEYLKNPTKFTALGGKLPKGVLLVGPPGTGKTLLARAVAGEASVPFFFCAGPEFDEVLVGQGARRVRDLFRIAKERAPCVIFIDEIDSIGSTRTNSALHPYANQTINQLLSEMDGFHQNEGVIILGATNRPNDLDKAVLRPGRFDFQVYVGNPDFEGRKDILIYYLNKILSRDIDVEFLARLTSGCNGAQIEYMINQAALKAAVDGATHVTMNHFEYARDKMLMGPARALQKINEETNKLTASHEAGHAIVSLYTKDACPIYKVTIIPRGRTGGHTEFVSAEDNTHDTKSQLLAKMDVSMGGRLGEELVFGPDKVTSGASADIKAATDIAELMVKELGMSEKVGLRRLSDCNNCHATTNDLVEHEIKRILQESYERAKIILKNHTREHKLLTEALLKYETLDGEDVRRVVAGKPPKFSKSSKTEKADQETQIADVTENIL